MNAYRGSDLLCEISVFASLPSSSQLLFARFEPLDRSVHGFREFLIFCLEFYELLERTREFPLLQSGFWHYHSYWFDYLGRKVGKDLENALAQFAAWQVDPQSEEVSEASRHSLEHMRDVVSHLTSGEYGVALRHAIS